MPLRALRGATTVDVDEVSHLTERMVELFTELFERNDIDHDDVVSIIFTATDDIRCTFPATAARTFGLGDVPLICARELDVEGGHTPVHPGDAAPRDRAHPGRAPPRLPARGRQPP